MFLIGAVSVLGKEQFVAVYLSAGVVSSFTSHFYKALIGSSTMSLGAVSFSLSDINNFTFM